MRHQSFLCEIQVSRIVPVELSNNWWHFQMDDSHGDHRFCPPLVSSRWPDRLTWAGTLRSCWPGEQNTTGQNTPLDANYKWTNTVQSGHVWPHATLKALREHTFHIQTRGKKEPLLAIRNIWVIAEAIPLQRALGKHKRLHFTSSSFCGSCICCQSLTKTPLPSPTPIVLAARRCKNNQCSLINRVSQSFVFSFLYILVWTQRWWQDSFLIISHSIAIAKQQEGSCYYACG